MSQSRPKNQPTPPPSSSIPGILSAVVVLLILGLIGVLLFNRTGSGSSQSTTLAPTSSISAPAPTMGTLPANLMPTATTYSYASPPPMSIAADRQYTATITTPRGEIVIELLPKIAPVTVNNFVFLARNNFYNGLTWHRVLEGFMAQGGDPRGDGTGGPGYSIPAEFSDQILFDSPGLVAMARSSDPDSAGSQFFITTAATPWLNDDSGRRTNYTIFGRVIQGQEIVDAIPLRDPSNPTDLARPGEMILGVTISEQ